MGKACAYLGECGGCVVGLTLEEKIQQITGLLEITNFEVFYSPKDSFRARAELAIYHQDDKVSYAMRKLQSDIKTKSHFICIQNCKNLSENIQRTLPILLGILNSLEFSAFKTSLFGLEILSNQKDSLLLTFLYHRKLEDSWLIQARILKEKLENSLGLIFQIIGRSRGIKLVVENDYLVESLKILGRDYFYRYNESSFTQPNPSVNVKMITWVLEHLEETKTRDLLEMYCGCGNFTFPLAQKFRKVLATEVSKSSIKAAKFACSKNKICNIEFVRLSGAECVEAFQQKREFYRLKEISLNAYDFKAVFVDPPRSGLGDFMCHFLQRFSIIIYISCNPLTLIEDLKRLLETHRIQHLAFFDQFPHTHHLEMGVILEKFIQD